MYNYNDDRICYCDSCGCEMSSEEYMLFNGLCGLCATEESYPTVYEEDTEKEDSNY